MSLSSDFLSRGRRSWISLLPVLLGALAAMLLGATANGSAPGVAETRVGARNVVGEVLVEPPEHVSAGQVRVAAENRPGFVVATGVAANTGRGLNELGGVMAHTSTNAAGGRVFTSIGTITQNDFRGIVNGGLMRGDDVHILTGTHGLPDGSLVPDASLFADDVRSFGNLPGVTVHDLPNMAPAEVSRVLNSPGTIIGGFCNSGACLAGRG